VAKTLFEALGYRLGQKAAQAKNAFELMGGGTEEESLRAEIRLGHDMASALLEQIPLVEANDVTLFAGQVGRWLASHVKEKKLPFAVWVTAERQANAFALPGGPIFVSWPLLELCQDQRDQIAFVLGHEMAHIVRRHTLDRLVQDAALSLLMRQAPARHAASAWLGQMGQQVLAQAFSKENELEADAFAQALIRTAGGDPRAGEALLEKLVQEPAAVAGSYFANHPPLAERLANLRTNR
jgi:predicted Zn-dependent protease